MDVLVTGRQKLYSAKRKEKIRATDSAVYWGGSSNDVTQKLLA